MKQTQELGWGGSYCTLMQTLYSAVLLHVFSTITKKTDDHVSALQAALEKPHVQLSGPLKHTGFVSIVIL